MEEEEKENLGRDSINAEAIITTHSEMRVHDEEGKTGKGEDRRLEISTTMIIDQGWLLLFLF